MNRFTKWAEREFGMGERVIATLLAGVVFVVLIPCVILKGSAAIDRCEHLLVIGHGLELLRCLRFIHTQALGNG